MELRVDGRVGEWQQESPREALNGICEPSPWSHFSTNNMRTVSTPQEQPGQDRVCMRDVNCTMFNVFGDDSWLEKSDVCKSHLVKDVHNCKGLKTAKKSKAIKHSSSPCHVPNALRTMS